MIITRKSPLGGRPLEDFHFPLHTDKQGNLGFLVGYVPKESGVGDKILIRISDAESVANKFGLAVNDFQERFKELKPKQTLREKLIRLLGGSVDMSH